MRRALIADAVELIDTLWNVNPVDTMAFLPCLLELIDTLWNVNRSFNAALTVSKLN